MLVQLEINPKGEMNVITIRSGKIPEDPKIIVREKLLKRGGLLLRFLERKRREFRSPL